jgi:endonuclease G
LEGNGVRFLRRLAEVGMKAGAYIVVLAALAASAPPGGADGGAVTAEVHCKHFFYGCPTGTAPTNDLIIRDAYAMSTNDESKFADWVAYRLDATTAEGNAATDRNWKADPWLAEDETLEPDPDDYRGAHEALHVDRGHQAPLASFKGTDYWPETNYYSNITPQYSDLNRGPWKRLEEAVRELARAGNVVYVITGPLYEREMPPLPHCDEPHRVPSGYWKIIARQTGDDCDTVHITAFIFDQETPGDADVEAYATTVDEVEERTGLDFFSELPDGEEEIRESITRGGGLTADGEVSVKW